MAYTNTTGLPSVTQVINPWLPTEFFTEESRRRGTYVHEWMEAYLKEAWFPLNQPQWKGYIDSTKRWLDKNLIDVHLSEERLIHKALNYCGKPDIFGTVRFKQGLGEIDLKTGVAKEDWHALQGWAYIELGENNGFTLEWGGCLYAHADGSIAEFVEHPSKNWDRLRTIFLSHLNCWNFYNK